MEPKSEITYDALAYKDYLRRKERMDTASRLSITDGSIKAVIEPRLGGSILEFSIRRGSEWLDIMRKAPAEISSSSDASSFLMAPYPNRIRDGRFSFAGISHQLRFPEKHAIHGDVRNRKWKAEESSATSTTLHFDSRDLSDLNFPFLFSVEQSFDVADSALTIKCVLRNEGTCAFPAGFGFHPYFNRALGKSDEDVALTFSARGAYPFSGEVPLPESMAAPLTENLDFSKPKTVPEGLDHCFAGFGGLAELRWPKSHIILRMRASKAFSHLVLYSPPEQPFIALEPQTQMNDGFNYLAQGETETGVVVLEAGQELAASFSLTVETAEG